MRATIFASLFCLASFPALSGCGATPGARQVRTAIEILDNLCQIVDVTQVDPRATELCVDERQISDILRVILGQQGALPPPPPPPSAATPAGSCPGALGSPGPRPVRLRLPEGKTAADLQKKP
jgi:hypothetical protein